MPMPGPQDEPVLRCRGGASRRARGPVVRAARAARSALPAVRSLPAVLAGLALVASACASAPAPPAALPPAAEPAVAPPLRAAPAGTLVSLGGGAPEGIVADPVTGLVVVAQRDPDRLAYLDAAGGVREVAVDGAARHLELLAPGGPVLVPGEDTAELVEVALPGGATVARVRVLRQPHDAAAVDGEIFVADELAHAVSVVRGGRVVATLRQPVQPGGVAVAAGRVGVVDVRGNDVVVYDPKSLRLLAAVPAGRGPTHDVPLGGGRLAVADTRGGALYVLSLAGRPRVLARVDLPGRPYGLAADLRHHLLAVTLTARNQLEVFRIPPTGGALARLADLPVVRQPNSVAITPATAPAYVAGVDAGVVEVIRLP